MSQVSQLTGVRKAAIMVALVGEDTACELYRHLSEEDVQGLTQELAELNQIPPEMALQVLEEYSKLASTLDTITRGGADYARRILIRTFGEEGARQLLVQVSRTAELSTAKLESLQKSDPQQLAKYLEREHPQTIAWFSPTGCQAGFGTTDALPKTMRGEAVKRLAQLRQFSPEWRRNLGGPPRSSLRRWENRVDGPMRGSRAWPTCSTTSSPTSSKTILETIEKEDPKLALSIRNLMFTFEDLIGVPEIGVRELLSQMDKKTLALALRGASEELEELYLQDDVLPRGRNVEGRHGRARAGRSRERW